MISGSLIIYQQLQYVLTKDLGFNKAQTLTFHIQKGSVRGQVEAIKQQLLKNPHVESVAVAGNPIGNNDLGGGGFNPDPTGSSGVNLKTVQNLMVNEDFVPTMQIKMVNGRNFSQDMPTDREDAIIINETLVNELGWEDPIGRKVMAGNHVRTVIGVTRDFNTYSLQHKVAPLVLSMPQETNDQDNLYIRIAKDDTQATLNYISKVPPLRRIGIQRVYKAYIRVLRHLNRDIDIPQEGISLSYFSGLRIFLLYRRIFSKGINSACL